MNGFITHRFLSVFKFLFILLSFRENILIFFNDLGCKNSESVEKQNKKFEKSLENHNFGSQIN